MGKQSIDGGFDTTRLPNGNGPDETTRQWARKGVETAALAHFGATHIDTDNPTPEVLAAKGAWLEVLDMLGIPLSKAQSPAEPATVLPFAPAANPSGQPRVVATIRRVKDDNSDWRTRSACKDVDAELFFPVGTSGPALLQTEQAKAVCRRCPVRDACLEWAIDSVADGIWGGMTDEERREERTRRGLWTPRTVAA